MKSALYEGSISHRRHAVEASGDVGHSFTYPTALALVYLDELDDLVAGHPRWSRSRPDLVWWRRRDFFGDPALDLDDAVRREVFERLGRRPEGDIAVLGHLRTWGWLFNPLCVYYCFDPSGTTVDAIVLEVRNTPWHQRTTYVIDGTSARFAKEMHVSPFLGMDHEYVLDAPAPGERLHLHLGNRRGEEHVFDAALSLRREEFDRSVLTRVAWRRPLETVRVSAGIYAQAWRLWRRGAPFHPHPARLARKAEDQTT